MGNHRFLPCAVILLCSLVRCSMGACEVTWEANTKIASGATSSAGPFGSSSETDCRQRCLDRATCVNAYVQGTLCFLYDTSVASASGDAGASFGTKTCTTEPPATTANTDADTTTNIVTTASCSVTTMTRQSDTSGGSDYAGQLTSTSDSCRRLCQLIDSCQAATYVADSSACNLYASTATSSTPGTVHFQRQSCSDGTNCCFTSTSGVQGSGAVALTFSASVSSCEALCRQVGGCQGVTYRGGSCFVYSQSTNTLSLAGSTYSVKTCPQAASSVGALSQCSAAVSTIYQDKQTLLYGIIFSLWPVLRVFLG